MNAPETHLVSLQIDAPTSVTAIDANQYLVEATAMVVDSPMMMDEARYGATKVKALLDDIEAERQNLIGPINESHARVQSFFKKHSDPLQEASRIFKSKVVACGQLIAAAEAAEQKVRDDAANKERARLAAEAAAIQAKANEDERKLREQAAAAAAAGDAIKAAQLESKAEAKAEAGATKAAEVAMQSASTVAVIVAPSAPISGLRAVWKFTLEDEAQIPREFLCPDEKKIGAYGKAMKDSAKIPGVRFFNDATIAVRTK